MQHYLLINNKRRFFGFRILEARQGPTFAKIVNPSQILFISNSTKLNIISKMESVMYELTHEQIDFVAGGVTKESGTLSRPTRGESEIGRRFNDAAGMLNDFGHWLGSWLYDRIHSD